MAHIIILGNGIAGITAARHIRKKSDHKITVISGETDHFFSRTALMYIYMGHMKYEHTKPYEDHFWKKNRIELVRDWIKNIDFNSKELSGEKEDYSYDQLILALGSKPNKFGWPGQELQGVQGLYSYQDLELMEHNTANINNAVVVGGGLIGVEMAEMLHSRNINVTYLVRESHFWDIVLPEGEAKLIDRHIAEQHIDLQLDTELAEIIDDGNGKVTAVKTKSGREIKAEFVGLTVGVSPNVEWLKSTELSTEKGIMVDEYLRTNIEDVYAIGDCAQLKNPQPNRRPIEAVWYTGRIMGETVANTICNEETAYNPGIWFNSAKFFDIEYQTYGKVSAFENDSEKHFYWEAKDGKHCVNISYDPTDLRVLGVNTFGIRMRHEVWEHWIKSGTKLNEVVAELSKANFDPEFFKSFEPEIQSAFNHQFPDQQVRISKPSFFQRILNSK
jgi:3-phenylpropionate/trans-cinnamate dioxygenase ferredoxin reductase subunit